MIYVYMRGNACNSLVFFSFCNFVKVEERKLSFFYANEIKVQVFVLLKNKFMLLCIIMML